MESGLSSCRVAIAGSIGAGKSTLTTLLAPRLALSPVLEQPARNPFLDDFYAAMGKWAFHSQVHFLCERWRRHHEADAEGRRLLFDRTIYEDAEVFARNLFVAGHLSEREWESYLSLYGIARDHLTPPDLLVYLHASPEVLAGRVNRRARSYEASLELEYLEGLDALYRRWFADWDLSPKLEIETADFDPRRAEDLERIASKVEEETRV